MFFMPGVLFQELTMYQNSLQSLKVAQTRYQNSKESIDKINPDCKEKEVLVPLTGSVSLPLLAKD